MVGPVERRRANVRVQLAPLQQLDKLFRSEASLLDDGGQRSSFHILSVHSQSDTEFGFGDVFEDLVAASGVVNEESGSL